MTEAAAVHADIDALEPAIDASTDWKAVVLVRLLVRLRELTDLVHDIMALRRQIRAEDPRLAKLTFAQGESLVVPRLAFSAEGPDGAATSALADIRVGVNIIGLQRDAVFLPEQLRRAVRTMLDGIATHYRRRSLEQTDAALLGIIDGVIAIAVQDPGTMSRELLLQLGGIRRGLFPNAPPYAREGAPEFIQRMTVEEI